MTQERHLLEVQGQPHQFSDETGTWREYHLSDESTLYFEEGEEDGEFFSTDMKNIHIERMDVGQWWVGIDLPNGKRLSVNFYSKKPITISWREDV